MKFVFWNFFNFVLLLLITYSRAQNCNTPTGKQGMCIPIDQCSTLNEIFKNRYRDPSETRLLRNSQCGQENRKPKVCCESTVCTTPDGIQGECIGIDNCSELNALANLPRPLSQNVIDFLKKSACKGSDRYSVCCSGQPPSVSTDTRISKPTDLKDLLPAANRCGLQTSEDRIVGGEPTSVDEYPWLAIVQYRTRSNNILQRCGASLISKRYALTAAHCVIGSVLKKVGTPVSIVLGEYDKNNKGRDCIRVAGGTLCNDEPVTIPIEKTIPHPQYENITSGRNDIALIRLKSNAPYTVFIRPICLPTSDIIEDEDDLIVTGWGLTEFGKSSNLKLQVSLPRKDLSTCLNGYTSINVTVQLWDKQICAGGEAGKDSCKGDSGGPLMSKPDSKPFQLIGVVSYGPSNPCARPGVAGVYTKVFAYLDWIKANIEP